MLQIDMAMIRRKTFTVEWKTKKPWEFSHADVFLYTVLITSYLLRDWTYHTLWFRYIKTTLHLVASILFKDPLICCNVIWGSYDSGIIKSTLCTQLASGSFAILFSVGIQNYNYTFSQNILDLPHWNIMDKCTWLLQC